MSMFPTPRTATLCAALLAPALAPAAEADGGASPHHLGDHPAVVVQRLSRSAGYDYASKFYPHPAWLRLYPAPPPDTSDERTMLADAGAPDPDPDLARRQVIRRVR